MHITQLGQDDLIQLAKTSQDNGVAKIAIDALVKQRDAPIEDLKWIALTTVHEDVAVKAVRGLIQNERTAPNAFAMIAKGCKHAPAATTAMQKLLLDPHLTRRNLMLISLGSCPEVVQMAKDALAKLPSAVHT